MTNTVILQKLIENHIDTPKLEARMIKEHADKHNLSQEQINQIINERIQGAPLDKILGTKAFYKHDFCVNNDVLSPRPDTEVLVEAAINIIKNSPISPLLFSGEARIARPLAGSNSGEVHQTSNQQPYTILDLGTGSGCILLSILKDCPNTNGVGVDISLKALKIAKQNAANLNLQTRTQFIKADWFSENFSSCVKEEQELSKTCFGKSSEELKQKNKQTKFDIIVSNPPYIPSQDILTLEPEVKNHDPILALDGGKDGLNSYRKLAEITPNLLKTNGCILLEVGIGQAADVNTIFQAQGFITLKILPDLSGIPRCLLFMYNKQQNATTIDI